MQFIFGHLEIGRTELGLARGGLGVSRSQGACIYRCRTGSSLILDLFSSISRKLCWIAWGVERIALHCMAWHGMAWHGMIDEARKTLKRARNVSMNLNSQ